MSEIWKYFKHGKTSISCNYCSQIFAFAKDKSTSKLWSHLQSKHTEQFTSTERNRKRKMAEFTSEPKQPAPSTSNKQPPIDELMSPNFAKLKRSELTNDVTEFVTMHNLPFTIAESPFLKRLVMKNYATNWMPSRHDVRAEIPKKVEECVKNLQASVFGQFVSLTLDEYSKGENALFCMTGTWLDETFEFHSRVLSVTSFLSRHTGENICREIDSTLNNLSIEKVVAATRDGARNMAAGCRIARIPSVWCFCHLIHVAIVTSFGKRPEISVLLKKSSDVINFFANSPTGTAAFRRVQGQCSTTFIKVL